MHTTVPPLGRTGQQMSPGQTADTLDAAADLIRRNGLHKGDYWPDSDRHDYCDGTPACLAGALAVALGARHRDHAGDLLLGPDPEGAESPHPTLAAVMAWLDVAHAAQVFGFSDTTPAALVVFALEGTAQALRDGTLHDQDTA